MAKIRAMPIPGWEGLYYATSNGEIHSCERVITTSNGKKYHIRDRVLKPSPNGTGYEFVGLHKDNTVKLLLIHRLVAMAFIPNPLNLPQVNHKNENKLDNRAENLEWCDESYNTNYGTGKWRKGEKISKPISMFTKEGDWIADFSSLKQAAGVLNVSSTAILQAIKKNQCCKGYKWNYKPKNE